MVTRLELTPERLVGFGFRGWLAGYDYQDISCWEHVWNTYATTMEPKQAKQAVTELSCWVRKVREASCRRIEIYPTGCARFCRDECIAISVIAACQKEECPAMRACAYALLGSSDVDAMLEEANAFAGCLLNAGQRLSPGFICNVSAVAVPAGSHLSN